MKRAILLYVLLLVVHAFHVLEEVVGRAYFIDSFYGGLHNFLIVMIVLLIIPLFLLYWIIKKNKIAMYLAFFYPVVMMIDGLDHIVEVFIIGKYIAGAAGLITGLAFLPIGIVLILQLKRTLPRTKKCEPKLNF